MRTRAAALLLCVLFAISCGSKGSPTNPSPTPNPSPSPTPAPQAPPPAPTVGYLTGVVTQSGPGSPVENAKVEILNAPNAGKWILSSFDGRYTIPDLTLGNATLRITKAGYLTRDLGIVLSGVETRQNIALQTEAPWSFSGAGNNVFDVPRWIRRVRIVGTYSGNCQNFVVWIDRDLLVNEILGRCSVAIGPRYEGTHTTTGGVAEVEISSGVSWSVTEVR